MPIFSKSFLHVIASMGDEAVMGALAVLIGAYLFWTGCRKGSKGFFIALAVALTTLAFVKYVLLGCGVFLPFLNLRSQAGSAALTTVVLGTFASVLSSQVDGNQKKWPFLILIPFVLAIETARVSLGLHETASAALGLLIGANIAFGLHMLFIEKKMAVLDIRLLFVLTLLVVVAFHHFTGELKNVIDRVGVWFTTC